MSKSPPPSGKSSAHHLQKATAADLSLFEKLDTFPAVIQSLASTLSALFGTTIGWTPKSSRPESTFRYLVLTFLRTLLGRTSARQQHFLFPSTEEAYEVACKKRGQQPNSIILEDGTRAHWVGSSKAEKIVLNFHGGGYVVPAADSQFELFFQVVDKLKAQGKNAACLFLDYDLAPTAQYPRQLQQAASLLLHLLNTLHISPSSIILAGDSAGANLCLALLSHISHPHPSTTVPIPKISLSQPIRGCALISPWVSFETTRWKSFESEAWKDIVGKEAGEKWTAAFLGKEKPYEGRRDEWSEPEIAKEEWWNGLQVENVAVIFGGEEVLRDGIEDFEKKFRRGVGSGTNVETTMFKGEYHTQAAMDLGFGYGEEGEGGQAKEIKRWIASKL